MFAAVDLSKLFEVAWVAIVSGVAVPALYALAIYGSTRAADARRNDKGSAATGYGALAIGAGGLFAVAIVLAISFILSK